jgi:hypothetical protein
MPASSDAHWTAIYKPAARLGPPLFVDDSIAAAYQAAIAGRAARGLLLGVTPQLADFAADVTAVERNPTVIATRWPGDTPQRRSICADWRDMTFPPAAFTACIGDGSLNSLPDLSAVNAILARVAGFIETGGPMVFRVYLTPEECEPVDAVFAAARARQIVAFGALKWRLAMAIAHERRDCSMPVADIRDRFEREVPDRARFSDETGLSRQDLDTIDIYRDSAEIYCFPTESELRRALPATVRFVGFANSGSYELAERCPLAVLERV